MADNILNARIKLKYDTWDNWELVKNTFTPLAGEVILYYIPSQDTGHGMTRPCVAMKVGDGTHVLSELSWTQAQAADVYNWAKQPNPPTYEASEINATKSGINGGADTTLSVQNWLSAIQNELRNLNGEGTGSIADQIQEYISSAELPAANITGTLPVSHGGTGTNTLASGEVLIGNGTSQVTTKAIDTVVTPSSNNLITSGAVSTALAGLTGAMHFKGKSTIDLSLNANKSADPVIIGYDWSTKQSGDVVLNSTGAKEFVWNGTEWIELGDEVSFAIKGSITNNDIADNAAINQSKIANLTDDLNSKAPQANPTFTGTVTLPATAPTQDTQAATKKYVDDTAAAANTTYTLTWNSKTAASDKEKLILTPSAGTAQKLNLKTVATTADIYDLENAQTTSNPPIDNGTARTAKYFILDCGDSTHLTD